MDIAGVVDNFLGRRDAAAAAMPADLVERDPAIITLISIVYSTIPKTFAGPATLVTVTAGQPVATATPKNPKTSLESTTVLPSTTVQRTSTIPTSSPSSTTTQAPPTTSSIITPTVAAEATRAPSASASAAPSGGMTGGAKAGLAIGLLALFGLVIAGVVTLYRRRKYQQELGHRLDDEKDFLSRGRNPNYLPPNPTPMTMASTAPAFTRSAPPPAATPMLDASPATRSARFSYEQPQQSTFDTGFIQQTGKSPMPVQRPPVATAAAVGAAAGVGAAALAANNASSPNPSVNDPNNPFGNHAEKLATSPPQDIPLPPSPKPDNGQSAVARSETQVAELPTGDAPKSDANIAGEVAGAGAAGVAGASIVAATAATATNNRPESPTPGASTPPGENVHRAQLDFVPSMDDELEVRAGGLVRILYEYDDGWALCMRMDRSQQGVVPRTCLSKNPVKPRPISPTQNRRGPPPQGMRGAPSNGRPGPPGGRPMTPTGRSGPYPTSPQQGRSRANSSSQAFQPYQPYANPQRSQSPGPHGGSKLRPQESSPNLRRISNSMGGGAVPPANMSTGALPSSGRPSLEMPNKIPTRKPVPSQSSINSS